MRRAVHFVLEDEKVPFARRREKIADEILRHRMVRARVIENRVLPVGRHLNEGVTRRGALVDPQMRDVGTFGREEVAERSIATV